MKTATFDISGGLTRNPICVDLHENEGVAMKLKFDLLHPAEAAQVSGVSLDNQRNLRRAGYLPKNKGHARFTLLDVCRLLVFGMMSERGIGPKVVASFADTAARGILHRLLSHSRIYSTALQRVALEATRAESDESLEKARAKVDFEITEELELSYRGDIAREFVAEAVESHFGIRGEEAPNLFIYWSNGHPEFFYNEDDPFGDCDYSIPAWQGPAIMFSIGAVAYLLASRLSHPVIHLETED